MENKKLQTEIKEFRRRLKTLRDQYSDMAGRDLYVEVEDKARRAYIQLGRAQDSLESLSEELARAEKHMSVLVAAERKLNKERTASGKAETTTCHAVHRDFAASDLFKMK
jgi:chromosome segregation ATPase